MDKEPFIDRKTIQIFIFVILIFLMVQSAYNMKHEFRLARAQLYEKLTLQSDEIIKQLSEINSSLKTLKAFHHIMYDKLTLEDPFDPNEKERNYTGYLRTLREASTTSPLPGEKNLDPSSSGQEISSWGKAPFFRKRKDNK